MEKIRLDTPVFLYPMPMTLVGAMVDDRPNWLAAAWVTPVNFSPLYFGVALGKGHHTSKGIRANRQFSISLPGRDLLEKTDFSGLVSGTRYNKSTLFTPFFGQLKEAPMVRECPLALECRLVKTVDLPADEFFIGEVAGAWSEERFLSGGMPDIERMHPFTLTMPDNRYWAMGECIGRAWHEGERLQKR